MSNSHSKTNRITVRRLIASAFVLALIAVALLPNRSSSSAAPTPPERRNVRVRISGAKEYASGATVMSPMFAAITVDRTDDVAAASACTAAANDCSLRGAVAFANLNPGTTINVPAGTYNLTISGAGEGFSGNNSIGDVDIKGNNTSIVGAGSATTIIHQTSSGDRVVEVNPNLDANFTTSISGVTISGGTESTGVGGGGIISGSIGNSLTLSDCVISGNSASGAGTFGGGGISHEGGNLTITNCTFSGNSTSGSGGAVGFTGGDPLIRTPSNGILTISGSTFSNNSASSGAAGGGAADLFDFNTSNDTYNLSSSSFTGNSAPNGRGGAVIVESGTLALTTSSLSSNSAGVSGGAFYNGGISTITFSRLAANSAPTGSAVFSVVTTITGNDNWWGRNTGPTSTEFRNSTGPVTPLTWLELQASASPSSICAGSSSTISADIKKRNTGADLTVELNGLPAFPASFISATPAVGNISGASANFVNGAASATFNGTANGTGNIDVTADSQTVTASVTVESNTTSDPSDQAVCQGDTATFSTTAGGPGPFHYSWTVDGSPSGGDSATLNVNTTGFTTGNHTVSVTTTGACSSATQSATLTVVVTTTSDPADQTVCQGATASFSTTAGGTGPFHYAWTVDGSAAGGDSPSLNVNTTSLSVGNHTVSVTTTGTCGTASQSATLTVNAPTTTTDPADQSVCEGATANFSTTAGGTGPFHYAWTVDGSPAGADSPTLSVNTTGFSTGTHTVSVTTTGSCGSASQSANLNVNNGSPTITVANSLISIWPPNHQYQNFTLADFGVTANSNCEGDLTSHVVIVSVTSDELDDNPLGADGHTVNDIVIAGDCKSVQLRRERDGDLDGRVYTVTFAVTDSNGHTATATARVTVPLDQSSGGAVDSGPHNTVNGNCP